MQQLTSNVFVETQVKGCNFGFVTTSDGLVMIDSPHKPSDALKLKAEIARHGQLRFIINTEPHGDHWTGNAFFQVPVIAHEGVRTRILNTDMEQHLARVASFGPEEPKLLENYVPNLPVITFQRGMTLHVGDHTFQMIHMPGHTLYQAAILIKEDPLETLTAMTERYPMDVGLEGQAPRVMRMNVANLYDYLTGAGMHLR